MSDDLAEWATIRPYHLADEISRAEEHVAALEESRGRIAASGDRQGATYTAKLDETDRMIADASAVVDELRAQAAAEFPDGRVDELVISSPARRVELARYPSYSYRNYLASHGGGANAQTAEVEN